MNSDQFIKLLSRREKDVAALLLQGMSNKQIALALGISERTIEFHLNNIYSKLQVASRVELILKLGKAAGGNFDDPVESTVELTGANVDNGNQTARDRAAYSWRNTVSLIKKEVAMTIHISFEELENYLRKHSVLFGALVLLIASAVTHYVLFSTGLYFWASYIVLTVLLGYGSLRFGRALKNTAEYRPLAWLIAAVVLPWLATAFDQLYLSTVLRYTDPIAVTLINLSATAEWLVSPEGTPYRSTHLSATSDTLWFIAIGYMLLLFFFSTAGKRSDKKDLATA